LALRLLTILTLCGFTAFAFAAHAGSPTAGPRIVEAIDEANLVQLIGQTHPLALPKYELEAVPDNLPMEHMFLQLRRSLEQEETLECLIQISCSPMRFWMME
jgi:hypothetical protein